MADDRQVYLSGNSVLRSNLFDAARELIGDKEPRGPALIVAQAAVEVGFETAIDFVLLGRSVYDPLRLWVIDRPTRSWSPTNKDLQALWLALTGDTITQAPSWQSYAEGVKLRHDFAHRAIAISRGQASSFVEAAEQLADHVYQQVAQVFVDVADASIKDARPRLHRSGGSAGESV